MSSRNDIIDGRDAIKFTSGLIYTEVLGWIDLGHARGDDIRILMKKFQTGEQSGQLTYDVTYAQGMVDSAHRISTGKFITWKIRKGRTYQEQQSIALAMMMMLARRYESFQQQFPFYFITDSGFSGEDLVSNLLGYYRIMRICNPFPLLRPVSKEEALKRWDYYGPIGSYKNEDFLPLLFPDPEKFRNAQPRKGVLPGFMTSIQPYRDFNSGNVYVTVDDGSFVKPYKKIEQEKMECPQDLNNNGKN